MAQGPPGAAAVAARRLLAGSGAIAFASLLGRLASIPASPYLTERIGPEGYGIAALVGTAAALASVVGLLGLDVGYTRLAGDPTTPDAGGVSRLCWRLALGGALAAGLLAAVGFHALGVAPRAGPAGAGLSAVVALFTLLSISTTLAGVRRRLEARYLRVAVALLVTGVGAVVANVLLAAYWRADEWALLGGSSIAMALGLAIAGVPVREIARPSGLERPRAREVLALGLAALGTAPAYWILSSADRWFLAAFHDEATVGVYSFAAQVGLIAGLVPVSVGAAWLPEVTRLSAEKGPEAAAAIARLWERVAAVYLVTWVAVSVAGGDLVRLLSAPAFHRGAAVVPAIAAAAVLNGFVQLGLSGFILARRLSSSILPWAAGAALCAGLHLVLVPRYEIAGAAAASATSFLLLAVVILRTAQRLFPVPLRYRRLGLAAVLALGAGALGAPPLSGDPLVSLLLKLPAGAAFAAVLAGLVAPEWLAGLFLKVRPSVPRPGDAPC